MDTVLLLLGALASGGLLAYVTGRHGTSRQMRHALLYTIADAPEDRFARIAGTVVAGEVIEATLSGRPCVLCEATIEWEGGGPRKTVREVRGVAFAIDDGTGRAVVDPEGASVQLTGPRWPPRRATRTPDEVARRRALIDRYPETPLGREFVCRERIVAVGDRVALAGHVVRGPDPGALGYRDMPATRLGFDREEPVLLSDDDRAKR